MFNKILDFLYQLTFFSRMRIVLKGLIVALLLCKLPRAEWRQRLSYAATGIYFVRHEWTKSPFNVWLDGDLRLLLFIKEEADHDWQTLGSHMSESIFKKFFESFRYRTKANVTDHQGMNATKTSASSSSFSCLLVYQQKFKQPANDCLFVGHNRI